MADLLKFNFVSYKKGSYVVVEGKENADHFFIIQQGKVKISKEMDEVMVVNQANFKMVITSQPPLVAKITTLLADRIWFIYKQLANTIITNPLGRMYDAMLIQLEKNRAPVNDPTPYTFDFGPVELANMAGLSREESNMVLSMMLKNKKVRIENNRIHTTSMIEIFRQAEYYRKMHKIEKARKENKTAAVTGGVA
jgi:CRP-like cAMP-binding protein